MPFKPFAPLLVLISLLVSAPINAEPDSVEASPEVATETPISKSEPNSNEPRRRGKTKNSSRKQTIETNNKPDAATQQKLDQLTQQIKQLQTALQTIQTAPVNNTSNTPPAQAEPLKVISPATPALANPSISIVEANNSSQFSLSGVLAAFAGGMLGVLSFQQLRRYLKQATNPANPAILAADQISLVNPSTVNEVDESSIELIYPEAEADPEPEPDSASAPAESLNEIADLELSPGFNFDFTLPQSSIPSATTLKPQSSTKAVKANQTKNGKQNRA